MASDECRTVVSSIQEDAYDDIDVGFDHDHDDHQPHRDNFARFSMCTISIDTNVDVDDDYMGMYMSKLSIESFDTDADEEFSGEELFELSSDSDKEPCYFSLPSIPLPHHPRNRIGMITRPKGGRRSLCMDTEEVKACRDLGFELEHESIVEVPSSGWRISGPGDDPRDVKARLKMWAQAVALASTLKNCS